MPRPFQFRLRTMFWMTALVALVAALWVVGAPLYREYQERRNADEILKEIGEMPMPTPKDVADKISERSE